MRLLAIILALAATFLNTVTAVDYCITAWSMRCAGLNEIQICRYSAVEGRNVWTRQADCQRGWYCRQLMDTDEPDCRPILWGPGQWGSYPPKSKTVANGTDAAANVTLTKVFTA